jgi:hypothetical protein
MKYLFIPYELAVIAKEKGFKDRCFGYYEHKTKELNYQFVSVYPFDNAPVHLPSPIYQQIIDWLREKHSIVIYTTYFNNSMGEWWDWRIAYTGKYGTETKYYDALNSAIKESFSLIKPISTNEVLMPKTMFANERALGEGLGILPSACWRKPRRDSSLAKRALVGGNEAWNVWRGFLQRFADKRRRAYAVSLFCPLLLMCCYVSGLKFLFFGGVRWIFKIII